MPNNHMNARLYAQHEVELMVPIIVISSFIMLIQCISCLVISSPHHKQQQLPGKNKQQQQLVIDEEENRGWLVGFQHKLADCCLHLPNQQTF
ncbi:hypothetical protein DAI22_11g242200 [Oryza sativa Japonica Group]|nr:hypothetical protein DAI22_11g242200 [Oryza sativa Japonica Group]KAF2912261.1 hypothetical protein DAI22_11g242200 [Oryza sativa Japonica Group]